MSFVFQIYSIPQGPAYFLHFWKILLSNSKKAYSKKGLQPAVETSGGSFLSSLGIHAVETLLQGS